MNSTQVLSALREIAGTSSTLAKTALLKELLKAPTFRKAVQYALEPHKRYGVLALPHLPDTCPPGLPAARAATRVRRTTRPGAAPAPRAVAARRDFNDQTWQLLDSLLARRLSGNGAQAAIFREFSALNPESAHLLSAIITKDLGAGIGASLVNKAMPGLIPEFPYMRCSTMKESVKSWPGFYVQTKADGMFVNIDSRNTATGGREITVTSRQGKVIALEALGEELFEQLHGPHYVYDCRMMGELVLIDAFGKPLPRQESNGAMNSVNRGGKLPDDVMARVFVWDVLPLHLAVPGGESTVHYSDRLRQLTLQVKSLTSLSRHLCIQVIRTEFVHTFDEAYAIYLKHLEDGEEGVVLKHPEGVWKDHTSPWQVKLKQEEDVDLELLGFIPGKGKNADTFGSIEYGTRDGKLIVAASGIPDDERRRIWANKDSLIGTIGVVRANGVMRPSKPGGAYSMFLPRHIKFHDSKTTADSLEEVIAVFDAARFSPAK